MYAKPDPQELIRRLPSTLSGILEVKTAHAVGTDAQAIVVPRGCTVSSATIATLVRMIESLPEPAQEQVVEHLREYLPDLQDEVQWDDATARSQLALVQAARAAKREIAGGQAEHFDVDRL